MSTEMEIKKNKPSTQNEVDIFLEKIDFKLPVGYIDFMKGANGAEIITEENYVLLWPLNEIFQNNQDYRVEEFAGDFVIIGSNGGGEAFVIEKESGNIYMMPFIGMGREDAILMGKTFSEFMEGL